LSGLENSPVLLWLWYQLATVAPGGPGMGRGHWVASRSDSGTEGW